MSKPVSILVVVHPGSMCGSADFNLGYSYAQACREQLIRDLDVLEGPILVIDGVLSDELPAYPALKLALDAAIDRARASGHLAQRKTGCDMSELNQVDAIGLLIAQNALLPSSARFEVTGAWYDPDGDLGCVNSVVDTMEALGFSVDVRDSAFNLDGENLQATPVPNP